MAKKIICDICGDEMVVSSNNELITECGTFIKVRCVYKSKGFIVRYSVIENVTQLRPTETDSEKDVCKKCLINLLNHEYNRNP